jgi:hypothetical protein
MICIRQSYGGDADHSIDQPESLLSSGSELLRRNPPGM